jgi:hypothetical protein
MENETKKNVGGRPPIAPATPDELWEAFEVYKNECHNDVRVDLRTSAAAHKPLTWVGFMAHLGVGYKAKDFIAYYKQKEGFSALLTRIGNIIECDQVEGAMIGDYNASIVARLNGYTDKTETKHQGDFTIKHEHTGFMPASSEDEIRRREGIDGTV